VNLTLCKCSVEFIDCLLLHCTVTNDLNSFLFTIFRVKLMMSQKEVDLYICWQECLDGIETVQSGM
jgi:predicted aldo/keto reductase-like oxidoreductase